MSQKELEVGDRPVICIGRPTISKLMNGESVEIDGAIIIPASDLNDPASVDGWQTMETAPLDKTPIIIAVPTKDQDDFIVGEAYFDPEHYGGDWWWAGTNYGDYHSGPISEVNYHGPSLWQHLPASPSPTQSEETP